MEGEAVGEDEIHIKQELLHRVVLVPLDLAPHGTEVHRLSNHLMVVRELGNRKTNYDWCSHNGRQIDQDRLVCWRLKHNCCWTLICLVITLVYKLFV